MKKIIECADAEGFDALLGERVTLLCVNYFYTGTLLGVNDDCVLLGEPSIIYETGAWSEKAWKDAQRLPADRLYVRREMVESYGVLK